ncbi:MAG: 2-C-methyl-D-erythritol 2,4-cyclodiphosphate synthase [Phycisphaerae bacterium]|nr:2-C-methyl-D-erythritol 2,4-cyclodiphosphate synthase [Phycisphaerae bacterium]
MNCSFRIGHGYDCHRLAPPPEGGPLVLGGLHLNHTVGPVAHSDGDALLHAVTDAVLGALALDDLGTQFPDSDEQWSGVSSKVFLSRAIQQIHEAGWRVANVDATVLLERPRLSPYRTELRQEMAQLLNIEPECVNIKGKSGEGLGPVGEGVLVEVHAVALLHKGD